MKYKKIFLSDDGHSFDTAKECREWEEYKLYYTPTHLSNEQIIDLLKTAFRGPFLSGPKDYNSEISLYVRADIEDDNCFDFYFNFKESEDKMLTFNGSIRDRDRDIAIGLGYEEKGEYHISPDWGYWNHIPMRKVYNYLRSIAYFQKKKEEPEINPVFRKKGWQKIYTKDYSIAYAEIVKDPAAAGNRKTKTPEQPVIIHLK